MSSGELVAEVEALDTFLRGMQWVDFEVEDYSGQCLTIKGSIDPSASPDVRIRFEEVFCVTDTAAQVFGIMQNEQAKPINLRFQVEHGNHVFFFVPEDYPEDFRCLVAAKRLSWEQVKKWIA